MPMSKSQLGQWGNSLALRIPKYIVEELDLSPNAAVECRVEAGKLVIEPIQVSEPTLEELLAGVVEPEEEITWGKPEGEEVW